MTVRSLVLSVDRPRGSLTNQGRGQKLFSAGSEEARSCQAATGASRVLDTADREVGKLGSKPRPEPSSPSPVERGSCSARRRRGGAREGLAPSAS